MQRHNSRSDKKKLTSCAPNKEARSRANLKADAKKEQFRRETWRQKANLEAESKLGSKEAVSAQNLEAETKRKLGSREAVSVRNLEAESKLGSSSSVKRKANLEAKQFRRKTGSRRTKQQTWKRSSFGAKLGTNFQVELQRSGRTRCAFFEQKWKRLSLFEPFWRKLARALAQTWNKNKTILAQTRTILAQTCTLSGKATNSDSLLSKSRF